jgi:hypothetical protein
MGFFEKTAGDGFFQKVGIMFGNEFNIASLFTPLTLNHIRFRAKSCILRGAGLSPAPYVVQGPHPLPSRGEGGGGMAQREFDANFIQFAVLDTRYMNICLEKSNDWDKNFHI